MTKWLTTSIEGILILGAAGSLLAVVLQWIGRWLARRLIRPLLLSMGVRVFLPVLDHSLLLESVANAPAQQAVLLTGVGTEATWGIIRFVGAAIVAAIHFPQYGISQPLMAAAVIAMLLWTGLAMTRAAFLSAMTKQVLPSESKQAADQRFRSLVASDDDTALIEPFQRQVKRMWS